MAPATSDIALLLFIRSAPAEVREKALLPSRAHAQRLAVAMDRKTRKLAVKTALPFFVVDEHLQSGPDFGSRLQAAFSLVFSKGYDKVIAIGNDCPALTTDLILRAADDLQDVEMVLGPDQDGGAYLIGFRQKSFDQVDFMALPWKTDQLFNTLLEVSGFVKVQADYPVLSDLNSYQALRQLITYTHLPVWLHYLLINLYQVGVLIWDSIFSKHTAPESFLYCLRAPPSPSFL